MRRCLAGLVALGLAGVGFADDMPGAVPRPVEVARTTAIPACTLFVDAAATERADGGVARPFATIGAAVEAAPAGAIICVAEGVYRESLAPGAKPFTLAGGFQHGSIFEMRDSAAYVSRAAGRGGSFIRIEDPAPEGDALTAIDGFEITGYAQAIYRDFYVSQRFDITNNFIHDNDCGDTALAGAGFALNNVSGTIAGNVFLRNECGRGGAGALNDTLNHNAVRIERNLVRGNAGNEPDSSHGGALYLFTHTLTISGNAFLENSVTGWGGGLYVGAYLPGNQNSNATLSWNVYRGNRAGNSGGGFFCDDGANCASSHEIYAGNCGGNILLDGGAGDLGTVARFDHLTNVGGLEVGCGAPGAGVRIDKDSPARDAYAFTNAIFWANAEGADIVATCMSNCRGIEVAVRYASIQTALRNGGIAVAFADGIFAPADPLFVDAANGDFHLRSRFGRWTPKGFVSDTVSSPLLMKGDPAAPATGNSERAGKRVELGAYGNSPEASYVR